MPFRQKLFLLFLTLWLSASPAQSDTPQPRIGYIYPAGARQGSVVQITAGGQFLRGASDVYVSGGGVKASIIKYIKPFPNNLDKDQREALRKLLGVPEDRRLLRPAAANTPPVSEKKESSAKTQDTKNQKEKQQSAEKEPVQIPDHPLLYNIENKSPRELAHIRSILFAARNKQQPNRQIAETVLIEITVAPDARPGDRELRIDTSAGLTNPVRFKVGTLPEIMELEPNGRKPSPARPGFLIPPKDKPLDIPIVINGQILPGDIDSFVFDAQKGQDIVIEADARSLIPYLADAVPGWFQAVLTLYDSNDKELAFVDDYRFNPDPVLFYKIPETGRYEVQIRDSIYRGREDFVYRISIGTFPFITAMFPLGGRAAVPTTADILGWNLPETKLVLDTKPGQDRIRSAKYQDKDRLSNDVIYAVDTLPERDETESNDILKNAERIELPIIINGRIGKPGDVDIFRFKAAAGDKIALEVYARRLNSPLDSMLELTDESGKVLQSSDDYVTVDNYLYKDAEGLLTHRADSYLLAELPRDGTYYVRLSDSQNQGCDACGYRLRITPPQPDFELRLTPSSLSARAGTVIPFSVYAFRKDGFNGDIEVSLKDAPQGFELAGSRIPAGRDCIRMTLAVPPKTPAQPITIRLEGRAEIGGRTITRPVGPADDMMQAFLYRHLVPSQELMVSVRNVRRIAPAVSMIDRGPVRIPAGGTAQVRFKTAGGPMPQNLKLQLNDPPGGLTLQDITVAPQGLTLRIKADKDILKTGFADNLIIERFAEAPPKQNDRKNANQQELVSIGFFPAVPIEIVPQ